MIYKTPIIKSTKLVRKTVKDSNQNTLNHLAPTEIFLELVDNYYTDSDAKLSYNEVQFKLVHEFFLTHLSLPEAKDIRKVTTLTGAELITIIHTDFYDIQDVLGNVLYLTHCPFPLDKKILETYMMFISKIYELIQLNKETNKTIIPYKLKGASLKLKSIDDKECEQHLEKAHNSFIKLLGSFYEEFGKEFKKHNKK